MYVYVYMCVYKYMYVYVYIYICMCVFIDGEMQLNIQMSELSQRNMRQIGASVHKNVRVTAT